MKTTLLKNPTNQGLDTQIYTAGYSHNCTHTQLYITAVYATVYLPQLYITFVIIFNSTLFISSKLQLANVFTKGVLKSKVKLNDQQAGNRGYFRTSLRGSVGN